MAYGTVNADVIQSSVSGVSLGAGNATNFKNRIINGAMVINQRGFSGTPTDGAYTLDRWVTYLSQASKLTISQNAGSVTLPSGFTNYLGVTSSSAYTVGASEVFLLAQVIEGYNAADLSWGTANGKTVTLSFQVYSSLTGTFGGSIRNSAGNQNYPFSYTISSANTWTSISVTIPAPNNGSTWNTTNGQGIFVIFSLGSGSTYSGTANAWSSSNYYSVTGATSVVGTNGATFYITGVQLEVGSSATGFEYRDYGRELIMCQRYFEKSYNYSVVPGTANALSGLFYISLAYAGGVQNVGSSLPFKVTKRADATVTVYSPYSGTAGYARSGSSSDIAVSQFGAGMNTVLVYASTPSATATDYSIQYIAVAEL